MRVIDAPAGAGRQWIQHAWILYAVQPGAWISLLSAWILLCLLLTFGIPSVGLQIAILLQPAFFGGFAIAARDQEAGLPVTIGHLFAGFHANARGLLTLGGVMLVINILVSVLFRLLGPDELPPADMNDRDAIVKYFNQFGAAEWFAFFGVKIIALLIDGALWFATPLLALHPMKTSHAIRWSCYAFMANFLPMLLFALTFIGMLMMAVMLSTISAMVVVLLGMFVFGVTVLIVVPLYALTQYTSYRQVFRED